MQAALRFFYRYVNLGFGFQQGCLPEQVFYEMPDLLVECVHKEFGAEITVVSQSGSRSDTVIILREQSSIPAAVQRMVELKQLHVLRLYASKARDLAREVQNFVGRGGALTERCIESATDGLRRTYFQ